MAADRSRADIGAASAPAARSRPGARRSALTLRLSLCRADVDVDDWRGFGTLASGVDLCGIARMIEFRGTV